MSSRNELYGINETNVDTVLTKNIFTTYVPISTAIYLDDKNKPLHYLNVNEDNLRITNKSFKDLLGVNAEQLKQIKWLSESRNPTYNKSVKAPGIDMGSELDGNFLIELEVKLTVVPTHAESKVTEMIVRQNTQFNFAERLVYKYGEFLSENPTIDELNSLIENHQDMQMPFIIHGLWKTEGHSSKIDEAHALDVVVISDLAYLKILLSSNLEKSENSGTVKTRIGRVVNLLLKWIKEFKTHERMTYREETQGSKDHLKITLYPVQYFEGLRDVYLNLRLSFEDFKKIVTSESIKKLSPERRLDGSIIFTLANLELEEE